MDVNTALLKVCDRPVKILLEGFVYIDTLKVAKLIMTHGGIVTTESDDDTIVLSPSQGFSCLEYPRIGVNWLHDCISTDKFLDIGKYILPVAASDETTAPGMGTSAAGGTEKSSAKIQNMKKQREGHSNATTSSESSSESDTELIQKKQKPEVSGGDNAQTLHTLYSQAEDQKIINWLIENKAISKALGRSIWQKFEAEKTLVKPSRPHGGLRYHFAHTLRDKFQNYTDDPSALSEFEKLRKYSKPHKLYSKEEERRIVEYLIENDAILEASKINIWETMVLDPVFKKSSRLAISLRTHFREKMAQKYKNYTKNKEALQKFRTYFIQKNRSYLEEENAKIVQYLIDNNAISRIRTMKIWEEMARAKILKNPLRTAVGLSKHFHKRLHGRIADYVNDPKVLKLFENEKRWVKKNIDKVKA